MVTDELLLVHKTLTNMRWFRKGPQLYILYQKGWGYAPAELRSNQLYAVPNLIQYVYLPKSPNARPTGVFKKFLGLVSEEAVALMKS